MVAICDLYFVIFNKEKDMRFSTQFLAEGHTQSRENAFIVLTIVSWKLVGPQNQSS